MYTQNTTAGNVTIAGDGQVLVYDGTSTIPTSLNAGSSYSTTAGYYPADPDSLIFDIEGKKVEFKGEEIICLKEMLKEWMQENKPELLL